MVPTKLLKELNILVKAEIKVIDPTRAFWNVFR
jgi:hypothetical protein